MNGRYDVIDWKGKIVQPFKEVSVVEAVQDFQFRLRHDEVSPPNYAWIPHSLPSKVKPMCALTTGRGLESQAVRLMRRNLLDVVTHL